MTYPWWKHVKPHGGRIVEQLPEGSIALPSTKEELSRRGDPERVLAIADFVAKGYTNYAIQQRLPGVPLAYMTKLRKFPWFQAEVDARIKALVASPIEAFGPRLPKALEVYDKSMASENEKVALAAATDIADRLYGKPKTTEQGQDTKPNITIVFGDYKPEQIIEAEVAHGEEPT